jgi:hypothetical protein
MQANILAVEQQAVELMLERHPKQYHHYWLLVITC